MIDLQPRFDQGKEVLEGRNELHDFDPTFT